MIKNIFFTFLFIASMDASAKSVFVTVPPQAGIVKQIAGGLIEVQSLSKGESCPETYSPTPKQIEALSKADLFLTLGMPFEKDWLKKAGVLKNVKTASMTKGIKLRDMETHAVHGHEHHHHSSHGEHDPHVWTSIKNVVIMAENTSEALKGLMPEKAKTFEANLKSFKEKAKLTDNKVKDILKGYKGRKLFVFHPYYGYFTDSYGLVQAPIEAEGKAPTAKELAHIIAEIKKQDNKVILIQPEFETKTARSIAKETGARLVSASIYSEDVLKNIEDIANKWNK